MAMPAEPHDLGPTAWTPLLAFSLFLLVLGAIAWFHPGIAGEAARPTIFGLGWATLLPGIVGLLVALAGWMRSDLRYDVAHDALVAGNVFRQRTGMILFLLSEAMLFFALFWGFVRFGLNPELAGASSWPPIQIKPEEPFGTPFPATLILVVSGLCAVFAHNMFLTGRRPLAAFGLGLAIALGAAFLALQVREFLTAPFGYTAGSFASLFYLAVGLHGAHVFIGASLLAVSLARLAGRSFTPAHHFGFEASVWYWHFVDAVWLLLFLVFYWWPYAKALHALPS